MEKCILKRCRFARAQLAFCPMSRKERLEQRRSIFHRLQLRGGHTFSPVFSWSFQGAASAKYGEAAAFGTSAPQLHQQLGVMRRLSCPSATRDVRENACGRRKRLGWEFQTSPRGSCWCLTLGTGSVPSPGSVTPLQAPLCS